MKNDVLIWINDLPPTVAQHQFYRCCGATWWCEEMVAARPFHDLNDLTTKSDATFDQMPDEAWLKAFAAHPRIGDFESLKMKYAGNKEWSGGEQVGAAAADDPTLHRLAEGNAAYEARFRYRFIVCATGKSAAEMLALLEARLDNDDATELRIAATEQRKITHLRLSKLEPDDS